MPASMITGEWVKQAACAGMDPTMFHPHRGEDTRPAEAVCARCPVTRPCLEWALRHREPGVWGGTTEVGRKRIRRRLYEERRRARAS